MSLNNLVRLTGFESDPRCFRPEGERSLPGTSVPGSRVLMAFPPGGRTTHSSALRAEGPRANKPAAKAAGCDRSPSGRRVTVCGSVFLCQWPGAKSLLAGALALTLLIEVTRAAPPFYDQWQTFDTAGGLPSNKVLCVYPRAREVWAGTDNGLACYRDGTWKTYGPADGLAHRAVLSIAEDPDTGDLWIGTMGGLNRYTAGRFDIFRQTNSGLANDVVYGVFVEHGHVWAATAAGTSRYDIAEHRWTIYNETNTPMHEIWCYSVTGDGDKVYVGVWGGGLLEYTPDRDRWRDYTDPDDEMEIDLFRNDGLVHDIVTGVSCDDRKRVWIGTYFGLSSYDGRTWRNFMDHDSPLPSNFINGVTAQGSFAWIATDNGLAGTDRESWWTYQRDPKTDRGVVTWKPAHGPAERFTIDTIFPHNYLLGVGFQGDDIWVATEKGVAHGTRSHHVEAGERAARAAPTLDQTAHRRAQGYGQPLEPSADRNMDME